MIEEELLKNEKICHEKIKKRYRNIQSNAAYRNHGTVMMGMSNCSTGSSFIITPSFLTALTHKISPQSDISRSLGGSATLNSVHIPDVHSRSTMSTMEFDGR